MVFHIFIFINPPHHIEDGILHKFPYKFDMRFLTLKLSVSQNVGAQNQNQNVKRNVGGSLDFEKHGTSQYLIAPQIYHHILIHQCFVDLTENLNSLGETVKRLKRLKCEEEVW